MHKVGIGWRAVKIPTQMFGVRAQAGVVHVARVDFGTRGKRHTTRTSEAGLLFVVALTPTWPCRYEETFVGEVLGRVVDTVAWCPAGTSDGPCSCCA